MSEDQLGVVPSLQRTPGCLNLQPIALHMTCKVINHV